MSELCFSGRIVCHVDVLPVAASCSSAYKSSIVLPVWDCSVDWLDTGHMLSEPFVSILKLYKWSPLLLTPPKSIQSVPRSCLLIASSLLLTDFQALISGVVVVFCLVWFFNLGEFSFLCPDQLFWCTSCLRCCRQFSLLQLVIRQQVAP